MRHWPKALLLASLVWPGCAMFDRGNAPVVAPPIKAAKAPIKPDDVTLTNVRDQARNLNEELDRDIDGEF